MVRHHRVGNNFKIDNPQRFIDQLLVGKFGRFLVERRPGAGIAPGQYELLKTTLAEIGKCFALWLNVEITTDNGSVTGFRYAF